MRRRATGAPSLVAVLPAVAGPVAGLVAGFVVGGVVAAAPAVAAIPDLPASSSPPITLTTENFGKPISLLDSTQTAWASITDENAYAEVKAEFTTGTLLVHQWEVHLEVVGGSSAVPTQDCRGEEEAAPKQLSCDVRLPVAVGSNRIRVTFTADGRVVGDATGYLSAATPQVSAGYELLDATGRWSASTSNQVDLLATTPTSLRYVVINEGALPIRLLGPCGHAPLAAGAREDCVVTGVRPAQSLAGRYDTPVAVQDPAGGVTTTELPITVRAVSGTFTLSRSTASSGQPVVITARGLPAGPTFDVQYRLDDQATIIGTSLTSSGSIDYGFVLPHSAPTGAARVNIEHAGLTVASLPLRITAKPGASTDAAAPPWGVLLLLLIPLVGVLALVWLRREPRAPRRSDPYPDATPATQEPEAAHRS